MNILNKIGFNKGDVIVLKERQFPDGALEVDAIEPNGKIKAHPLGGGFEVVLKANHADKFRVVSSEEQQNIPFHKAAFVLDGVDGQFMGWTKDELWNGWATPYFEFDQARMLTTAMPESKGRHDSQLDCFVTKDQEGNEEQWNAEIITTKDGRVKVYPIGAYSWCWDEVDSNN